MSDTLRTDNPREGLRARLTGWVTRETTGGILLLAAAALALLWANSPWRDAYHTLSDFHFGPEALHLNLSVAHWAADGLLAIFFFVVGVELKHELVAGSLSKPKEAGVPVLAAVGGMVVPALIYLGITTLLDPTAHHGWAVPTATDIAFALAVLALFGRGLPRALRVFLLTLAVVDDLLAIIVIAVFYTTGLNLGLLALSLVAVVAFAFSARMKRTRWWLLLPFACIAWALMHASGVHATIAAVLCGLTVAARPLYDEHHARSHTFGELVKPYSSGIALPVFAFFSAGVTIVDGEGPAAVIGQPVVLAIVCGLVIGKLVGVMGTTALVTKFTPLRLPDAIGLRDLLPIGFLCGVGFTVALLVAELSFPDTEHTSGAKLAVLIGSLLAALLGAFMLRWDARKARNRDMNEDGIDDIDTATID